MLPSKARPKRLATKKARVLRIAEVTMKEMNHNQIAKKTPQTRVLMEIAT